MFLDAGTTQALMWVGAAGALAGLVAGFFASAKNLIGSMLMGIIGSISFSAIVKLAGAPPVYGVGEGFSLVWGALGGFVLAYVVGRTNH